MMSVDTDLRSGRRLETGRRSESIIYVAEKLFVVKQLFNKLFWIKFLYLDLDKLYF